MATAFSGNWACNSIRKLMRQENTDAKEVADALSSRPEFLAVIQEVIDRRLEPDYDPDIPDGDPAQAVIGELSQALVKPSWEG